MVNDSGLIPVEYFVVVEIPAAVEKIGSIILPTQTQEADKLAIDEGTLVAVSPAAFNYTQWPEGARIPTVGDRVLFKRYAGKTYDRETGGVKRSFRLVADKDIMAIVDEAAEAEQRKAA